MADLQTLSPEQIATLAMSLLKKNAVQDLSASTIEAVNCNIWYGPLRNQLLEQYDWSFARKRVQLEQSATAPAYQYAYAYDLPNDCLMPLEARADIVMIQSDGTTNPPYQFPGDLGIPFTWIIEGNQIITNADVVYLKYTAEINESGLYTPSFCMALAFKIAGALAYAMVGNEKLAAMLNNASDIEAKKAMSRDALKGTQETFVNQDSWIRDRNSTYLRYKGGTWWKIGVTE